MNDFDYDCRERKNLARQARHRKCGSKSKKCSLSTDHMTNKQWRERNGAIMSINMNKPVSWKDFKSMSDQTQKEYILKMIDTYHVNASTLSEMFGVSPTTVRKHIQNKGFDIEFKVGHSMTSAQRGEWSKFLSQDSQDSVICVDTCVSCDGYEVGDPQCQKEEVESESHMSVKSFSLCFSGIVDVDAIANSLRRMMIDGETADVEIKCCMV